MVVDRTVGVGLVVNRKVGTCFQNCQAKKKKALWFQAYY